MHNVEYEIWERLSANERNPLKKMYLRILAKQLKAYEAKLLPKVDAIVTVTDDDALKFKALHPTGNYLTIPAGIDLDTWKYTPSKNYMTWYHIGSMEWHANAEAVHWYINSIHPLLQQADSQYKFSLAGKGIDSHAFQADHALEINNNVPSAFEFVSANDVCVVPLKSGSGIRLKILEAMAAGKLVVSTTVGAQGINYSAGVNILIADKPSEFLAIYERLMNGEINTKTIVKNARKLIEEHYSTDALAKKQISFYKTLNS
jgi:glycosyltransferase involved in cell wall biosynthesis